MKLTMKQISMLVSLLLLMKGFQPLDSHPVRSDQKADIIFILDSSGSIGADNFKRQLSFAANFTGLMRMTSIDVRFGVIQYSDLPQKEFDLNRYSHIADLQNAITNITYIGHTSATDMALQMILDEQMFSLANGGRDDAPDIIITMTDGASNSMFQTAVVADRVKASNVTIMAVGITSGVNVTELETIASKKEYVLVASYFSILQTLMTPLVNLTRTAIGEVREVMTNGDEMVLEIGTSGICQDGQYVRGVAHLPYPEDCTKVIQCYYNQLTNKTLAVIRRCPFGHFWNPEILNCAPSWTVKCPSDKCQNECEANSPRGSSMVEGDSTVTYPMSGKLRGYCACINGKSHPRCCPGDSVYIPGIGCYLNRGPREECGPEEGCKEGITICKKLPVWNNRTFYLENSVVLGDYPLSCIDSDFDIVHCRCKGGTLSVDQNNTTDCAPKFQTQPAANCSEEMFDIPVVIEADLKLVTFRLTLNLPSAHFRVVSTPQTCCQDCYSFKIWGDTDTVNFAMGNKGDGIVSRATILWKNATGDLDIVAMLHGERLTFEVAQDGQEVVTSVDALWASKSFACAYRVQTQSPFKNASILTKFEVFDCPHPFDNIYGSS